MLKRSGLDSVLVYDPDQDNCRTIQLFGGREVTQHAQGDLTLTVSVGDPDPHSLWVQDTDPDPNEVHSQWTTTKV